MLNSGGNLSGNPWGAILILIGSISWAFGSVYGSRITLPVGMMAGAIEMLAAGVVLMIASMIAGEKLTALPSLSGFLAVGYLALFGSIIAINAYMYLIRNVSPALATSYAYVNPVVAVLLGTGHVGKISLSGKTRSCASYSGRIKRVNESPACRSARWHLRRRSTLPDAR
ncbi:hypothetical protein G952_02050 [Escherichia coli UMEA 3240-1]|nr:hypothetical protein G952_02050 [Escherichia coli UMEA 3240-1]